MFKAVFKRLSPLVVIVACAGCGGGSSHDALSGPDPTARSVSATTPDGLTATLAQATATVPVASQVVYTLSLTNNTTAPVTIQEAQYVYSPQTLVFPGGLARIVDAAGNQVYPAALTLAGSGAPPPPSKQVAVIVQPGQAVSDTVTLPSLFSRQDRYRATATFRTGADGATVTSVGPLTITAR
jgi:hypothetical protein